jgi:segregation and condensation protein B
MLNDETLKALIEAIIYVAPEPVTLDALAKSMEGEERERVKAKLQEVVEDFDRPSHGIHIRQVAGGYKFSSKVEHHETLREFVKSLKPPIRLSKPALETLAVIAYRQPVTLPEIDQIRGVDCGGVIHTLMEKKLVVTAGRKNVVGRPILYRTSRDFLVHFGLRDVSDLPSLREFEEMARQVLGSELLTPQEAIASQPPGIGFEENARDASPAVSTDSSPTPVRNSGQDVAAEAAVAPDGAGREGSTDATQTPASDTKPGGES